MATTIAFLNVQRNVRVLIYPPDFPGHRAHGCPGCLGLKGDCTLAVAAVRDVVSFRLADGRAAGIYVPVGSGDGQIVSAIQAWATANPLPPQIGSAII